MIGSSPVIGVGVFSGRTSLRELYFCGDAPKFETTDTFAKGGTITAYYPADRKTWDRSNLSGNTISWTDTSVKNGQRYTYRIYGTNGTNISKVSPSKYRYYLSKNTLTSLSKSGKTFTAKWKSNPSATGYQIQYAKNSKFTGAKTVKVSSRKILSKKISPNFHGKCYVRVRTYKTVNKTNFYSVWSNVRSISLS